MAMARNVPVMWLRLGRPKLTLEAPQVVLTPSSSRSRRTRRKTCWPAVPMAPMGMTSGSTTMSAAAMPWSAALFTIRCATEKRTSGSSLMPVSSLEMATTAAPYLATRGSTRSITSSSPVTELTRGLPWYTASPASSASMMDESIDSGTSTTLCTSCTARASSAGSSASGMPALTSSMCAPAATCATASASTRLKSPAFISSASSLRPVGLMRSPIITKGRSKPIVTSRVADDTTVCVTPPPAAGRAVARNGARPVGRHS